MRQLLSVLSATLVVGCGSTIEELRSEPSIWTAEYATSFDVLANCLAGTYAGEIAVVPQLYQRAQRANVILSNPQGGSVLAEFQITTVAPGRVEVSWRRVLWKPEDGLRPNDKLARSRADRCAQSS